MFNVYIPFVALTPEIEYFDEAVLAAAIDPILIFAKTDPCDIVGEAGVDCVGTGQMSLEVVNPDALRTRRCQVFLVGRYFDSIYHLIIRVSILVNLVTSVRIPKY